MGTLVETTNGNYRLLFADKGIHTSVFRIYIYIGTTAYIYIYRYMLPEIENGAQAIFLNLFSVCS
jgi:hypothetical protein